MAEACFLCISELAEERRGEHHFSVAMGDVGGFTVTLDGDSVGDHALEALAGRDGYVVLSVDVEGRKGRITLCRADPTKPAHPYSVLRRGSVTVAAPPRPLSAVMSPSNLGGSDG